MPCMECVDMMNNHEIEQFYFNNQNELELLHYVDGLEKRT